MRLVKKKNEFYVATIKSWLLSHVLFQVSLVKRVYLSIQDEITQASKKYT